MEKEAEVNIIQIIGATSSMGATRVAAQIFGLGNDEQVYRWDTTQHKWYLHAS